MVTTAETCIGNRETPIEEYRVQVYYAVIDVLIAEMKQRFDNVNLSLMKSIHSTMTQERLSNLSLLYIESCPVDSGIVWMTLL